MKKYILIFSLFVLTILLHHLISAPSMPSEQMGKFQLHIIRAKPTEIKIVWKDKTGKQLEQLKNAVKYIEQLDNHVLAVMNGGIFQQGQIPSGLMVQEGCVLREINRENGKGNFFLKPNGVFLISTSGAYVINAENYPLANQNVLYAVQSGPLLLEKGKIHPEFRANSNNRLHRNGVGIDQKGNVVLVMTDYHAKVFPNLYEFAQLFQSLGCENAMFLDGDISQMNDASNLLKESNLFASMIVVTKEKNDH